MSLRDDLIKLSLAWQNRYGIAPAITSAISEYDAAMLLGMKDEEYSSYMQDKTAVSRGHDFIFNGHRYQIKAHRPSGKPGSKITNAGKARNYEWDYLIWLRYNVDFTIAEAWMWDRDSYVTNFDSKKRLSPNDMREGEKLFKN